MRLVAFKQCSEGENVANKKESEDPDLMKNLLRQMGLCEDEIEGALDLAEKIEKKIEVKSQTEAVPIKYETLPKEDLIKLIKEKKSQLNHFQNVVAPQFILLIKKYKDRLLILEEKLRTKNVKIEELSHQRL